MTQSLDSTEQFNHHMLTGEQFTDFAASLSTVDNHQFITGHNLSGDRIYKGGQNDELFVPLHNVNDELASYMQLTGSDSGHLYDSGAENHGFFMLKGDESSHLILITNDFVAAYDIHRETGYTTLMLGSFDSLDNVVTQVAPRTKDKVVVFCYKGTNPDKNTLRELAIESVDCTEVSSIKSRVEQASAQANLRTPKGFEVNENGVHTISVGEDKRKRLKWISSPIWVTAITRSPHNNKWGRMVKLVDPDGNYHELALPMELISSDNCLSILHNQGVEFDFEKKVQLRRYLSRAKPIHRARCLEKTGWYEESFVFPDSVIGSSDERLVYQPRLGGKMSYEQKGTLSEWRDNVASLCKGNSRLIFGVSVAFSALMLKLVNGKTTGFHFRSASSKGKSTILKLAQSVTNNPEHIPLWHSTVSGLEVLAASHNNTLLCLDEFGQLVEGTPKIAGEVIYNMGNGEGKQKTKSNGEAVTRNSWQLNFLSAGEVSLEQVLAQANMPVRGGHQVRLIDLPADAGVNLGAFDTVHEFDNGDKFAVALNDRVLKYYGTAARAFLDKVASDYQGAQELMLEKMDEFCDKLELNGPDPQVLRVARAFAQVSAAGEIASYYGITGWEENEVMNAVMRLFYEWINGRGGEGSQEQKFALEQIANALHSWGILRLSNETRLAARNGAAWGCEDNEFVYIHGSTFKNTLCKGLDWQSVQQILLDVGLLIPSKSRVTTQMRLDNAKPWMYKISKKIMDYTCIEAAEQNEEIEEQEQELTE